MTPVFSFIQNAIAVEIYQTATIQENLLISELMYNPANGEEFEYVELHNTHPTSGLSIGGVGFTNGIDLVIPNGTTIPAGGYLLIVPSATLADRTAFKTHYGLSDSVTLVGPYTGKLSNGGERITLTSLQTGSEIISFEYNDGRGWAQAADGAGHSLVPISTAVDAQTLGSLEYGGNWRASYAIGGSPGQADPEPTAGIVVNELLANAKTGESDWIELYNTANATIHLGDFYLSDDSDDLDKWPIPAVELEAGQWIDFDEQNDFDNPAGSGFGLSRDGETLYLSYLPGTPGVDRVVDAVPFKAQDSDRAWGRYGDGSPYFADTELTTRGASNEPASPTLVIDEMMVQPLADAADDDVSFEYVELYNASDKARPLQNSDGAYRLDGGVQFEFPADVEIPAGGRMLIVGFDPSNATALSAFLDNYGMSEANVIILGPYSGKLSNSGERIALEKPKSVDELTGDKTWGIVDEVIFFTQSPWTEEANGTGKVLQRIDAGKPGSDPSNWRAAEPTPDGQPTAVRSWMVF